MKCIRNRESVEVSEIQTLPKDFEFRVFGKLLLDLERMVEDCAITPALQETLRADIHKARQIVRRRDVGAVSRLADDLSTQSMLNSDHSGRSSAKAFFLQYQLGAFLKKHPFKGVDTRTPAIKKFIKAERQCALFNSENYKSALRLDSLCHPLYGNMIDDLRSDIENLLGAEPDLDRVVVGAKHGPGVALGADYGKGRSTCYYKWSTLPYSVTTAASSLAKRAISGDPRWIGALDDWYRERCDNRYGPIDVEDFWSHVLKPVDHSRITTVPKTALTDRTIAIEPLMNVYLQLGVDSIIRQRLKKRWKIDINSQELNQTLARQGAEDGSYATIDLSAASDTISLKLCEMLLPVAWYDLLLTLRCPKGELDGVVGSFDKVSSMGNGFTFALETLIFGALTRLAMKRLKNHSQIAVFGDDIVVPTPVAEALIKLLNIFGFSINSEKSFLDGPFRESCGSDWFLADDVRPVFLTRRVANVLDLYYLHNSLYRLERKLNWVWEIDFQETRRFIRSYIPTKYRNIYGPPSEVLDSYLFSSRRLPGVGQQRWHYAITACALTFNRKSSFFFRKLMVSLKGTTGALNAWDRMRRLTTGNSFDIVRRDAVRYKCTKRAIYY